MSASVSAPIAKNIMYDIIDELKLEPSDYTLEKTYNWYDTKYIQVPDIINKDIDEIKKELKDLKIEYAGNGNIIKAISPSSGTYLPVGSTIKILLGN